MRLQGRIRERAITGRDNLDEMVRRSSRVANISARYRSNIARYVYGRNPLATNDEANNTQVARRTYMGITVG